MGSQSDLIRDRRVEEAINRVDLSHVQDVQGEIGWGHCQPLQMH